MGDVIVLRRERCRIPQGEPDGPGWSWENVACLPRPEDPYGRAGTAAGVRAAAGAEALFIRFECPVRDRASLAPLAAYQPIEAGEHAWIDVYPSNSDAAWYCFRADFKGLRKSSRNRRMTGECSLGEVPDLFQDSTELQGWQDWRVLHGLDGGGWWVEMAIPWRTVGLKERPAVIGVRYGRAVQTDRLQSRPDAVRWPGGKRIASFSGHADLEHGEALLGAEAVAPDRIEIERPLFGRNAGRLFLQAASGTRRLSLRTGTEYDGAAAGESTVPIDGAGTATLFEYWLDRSSCSHVEVFSPPVLRLEIIETDTGRVLYAARFPMDRHLGICVDEPFGITGKLKDPPWRKSGARERWLDRVARALPRLHRRTTAQGAPSDFCLCREDGTVACNLMANDAWKALARLVTDRFASAEDRLIGAMVLVGQKSVTNLILDPMFFGIGGEQQYHSCLHEWMGPLSIVRYGGGPSLARSAVLARLLREMTDPESGKSFVTRVVSLGKDGGPRMVQRRYTKGDNLSPFDQAPSRVSAVAVERRGDHVLLDPTGLVFFPHADGDLASVREVMADEALRAHGAGRLAPYFASIDVEEMERQQPDRAYGRGVFPELCPNEFGADAPPSLRELQTPQPLVAGNGDSPPIEAELRTIDGGKSVRQGVLGASWDGSGLTVRLDVGGIDIAAFGGKDREHERVHLLVDESHDHLRFLHFSAGLAGERRLWREKCVPIQRLFKNLSTENWVEEAELNDAAWTAAFREDGPGYSVSFRVPWEILGLSRPPAVLGLNVWVEGRHPSYEQAFLSPPRFRLPADPFSFADLYPAGAGAVIREIDFGVPSWGNNTGSVLVENLSGDAVAVEIGTATRLGMRREDGSSVPTVATVPAGGTARVSFRFHVNPEEKMGSGRAQEISLAARCAGRTFYEGRWGIGYCSPVSAYQRFGPVLGNPPNPGPGEPDFIRKKTDFICSRMPPFERRTTRDGASSDFVLAAAGVEFDLMAAGVLDRIAAWVSSLFDTDLDRVLGLYFFAQMPSVARHMSGGHRIMNGAGPLSIIRGNFAGGGGNCGYHSLAFAGLMAHLRIRGRPLTAHTVNIWGHCIAAIGWRGSKALMDADVGHFFMTPDGGDLAVIEELRKYPAVLTTAGPGEMGRYLTFNDPAVLADVTRPDGDWRGVFPAGGPKA